MPKTKHAVNILFSQAEYARLVREATDLTLKEEKRVSVAELVRRLALANECRPQGREDEDKTEASPT